MFSSLEAVLNHSLYVSSSILQRYDEVTGEAVTVSSLGGYYGLVAFDGRLLQIGDLGPVMSFDPTTGETTQVSSIHPDPRDEEARGLKVFGDHVYFDAHFDPTTLDEKVFRISSQPRLCEPAQ